LVWEGNENFYDKIITGNLLLSFDIVFVLDLLKEFSELLNTFFVVIMKIVITLRLKIK
jgi:hypothetical protein